jgi:hypothetical protein
LALLALGTGAIMLVERVNPNESGAIANCSDSANTHRKIQLRIMH